MTDQTNKDTAALAQERSDGSERPFVIKKYNEVVHNAELVDIRLTSSSFRVEPEYFVEEDIKRKLENSGQPKWIEFDSKSRLALGSFDWEAKCKSGRRTVLSVKARYLIVYSISTDVESRYAEDFVANVGRFAVFPYFRSLVSQYSAASSAELPLLPVLRQRIVNTSVDED